MTDYKEEQDNEMEALESIYPDELTVIRRSPYYNFHILVSSQATDSEAENVNCKLGFTYTATYPDELPVIEINPEGEEDEVDEEEEVDDFYIDTLQEFLKEKAEENLGMVMVFTLVSEAQEKLTTMVEERLERQQDEAERIKREKEEAEQKKFEGTRVTIETFLAWKESFEEEMRALKKVKKEKGPKKLTGKDLFMQDHTLDDSDVKFLEQDGADTVDVDESLFQELEDLNFDDDDAS